MTDPNYQIRNMTKDELQIAIDWADLEGWNPGLHDLESFWAIDQSGFFVGLLNNEPISCLSAVAYDNHFGYLGFYIVKPELRGQGYGFKLWQEAFKHFSTQNIGLDGVVEQQANYQKSGFQKAHRNLRYKGKGAKAQSPFDSVPDKQKQENVIPLVEVSFPELVKYDRHCFPSERGSFLKIWISQPESFSFGLVKQNLLKGYGTIRKCVNGYKIGPLFADSPEVAGILLDQLRGSIPEQEEFFIDVPDNNPLALELVSGMEFVFETARMFTKGQPKVDMSKIYGVTTLEVG